MLGIAPKIPFLIIINSRDISWVFLRDIKKHPHFWGLYYIFLGPKKNWIGELDASWTWVLVYKIHSFIFQPVLFSQYNTRILATIIL